MRNHRRGVVIIGVIILQILLSACGGSENNIDPNNNSIENNIEEEIEVPTAEPTENLDVIAEVDTCLIGTWEIDNNSLIYYLSRKMNISDDISFVMGVEDGNLIWVFKSDGTMSMRSDQDLLINIDVVANDTLLGSSQVKISGTGEARYVSYADGYLVSGGANYDMTGAGNFTLNINQVMSSEAVVTLSPGSFSAEIEDINQEFTYNSDDLNGEASGFTFYECDEERALLYIEVGLLDSLKFYKVID